MPPTSGSETINVCRRSVICIPRSWRCKLTPPQGRENHMTKIILNSRSFWRRGIVVLLCVAFAFSLLPISASAFYRDPKKPSLNTIETDDFPWVDNQVQPIINNSYSVRVSFWEKLRLITKLYFRIGYYRTQPQKDVNASPILPGSGTSTTTSLQSGSRQGE